MKTKGQEEMVGFVLIMLVVAVIFLVFLGLYLGQDRSKERTESKDIAQFLEAISEVTTECGREPYYKLDRLIIECGEGEACPNNGLNAGNETCEVLEDVLEGLVAASWTFSENSPEKGFLLSVKRESDESAREEGIVSVSSPSQGNERGSVRAAEKPLRGGIIVSMEIYT